MITCFVAKVVHVLINSIEIELQGFLVSKEVDTKDGPKVVDEEIPIVENGEVELPIHVSEPTSKASIVAGRAIGGSQCSVCKVWQIRDLILDFGWMESSNL
jgi:hypothetical protein